MEVGDIVARDYNYNDNRQVFRVVRIIGPDNQSGMALRFLAFSQNGVWYEGHKGELPFGNGQVRAATNEEKEVIEMFERLKFLGAR